MVRRWRCIKGARGRVTRCLIKPRHAPLKPAKWPVFLRPACGRFSGALVSQRIAQYLRHRAAARAAVYGYRAAMPNPARGARPVFRGARAGVSQQGHRFAVRGLLFVACMYIHAVRGHRPPATGHRPPANDSRPTSHAARVLGAWHVVRARGAGASPSAVFGRGSRFAARDPRGAAALEERRPWPDFAQTITTKIVLSVSRGTCLAKSTPLKAESKLPKNFCKFKYF